MADTICEIPAPIIPENKLRFRSTNFTYIRLLFSWCQIGLI